MQSAVSKNSLVITC